MLVRKCAQGHKVYIFKPRGSETNTYRFSSEETVSFDAQGHTYVVTSDGAVVSRTDSWITAQSDYDAECQNLHDNTIGAIKVGKHILVDGVATLVE